MTDANLRAAAQANLARRLAALPPIDTDERWCVPCLNGEHGGHVDFLSDSMCCWCPTCDRGDAA